jgi:hypothetical protein
MRVHGFPRRLRLPSQSVGRLGRSLRGDPTRYVTIQDLRLSPDRRVSLSSGLNPAYGTNGNTRRRWPREMGQARHHLAGPVGGRIGNKRRDSGASKRLEVRRDEKQVPGQPAWQYPGQGRTTYRALLNRARYIHTRGRPRQVGPQPQSVSHHVKKCARFGETPSHQGILERYISFVISTKDRCKPLRLTRLIDGDNRNRQL